MPAPPDPRDASLADALLPWFRRHRRAMPWRPGPGEAADPYRVMVSEFMLQQTRVETVLRFFAPFLQRFPTAAALAAADEQEVLAAWAGLGYYRRARNLHAAAQAVVERCGGAVPGSVAELLTLPGVGRYTAGAIASIGFGVPAPILDGNVMRVLARLGAIEEEVDKPATQRVLWAEAERLVKGSAGLTRAAACGGGAQLEEDPDAVRDFNQALMELGALVCTPTSPACLTCPLREGCAAAGTPLAEALPRKRPKKKPLRVEHDVLAVARGGRWLFEQRPVTGMWAGMWQLPTREDGPADAAWVLERFGLEVGDPVEVGAFEHVTTHRLVSCRVRRAAVTGGRLRRGAGAWRTARGRRGLPVAKPVERALALLA